MKLKLKTGPADMLEAVQDVLVTIPAAKVAEASGLSTKQIYRIRWGTASPSIDTLQLVVDAIEELQADRKTV